MSHPTSIAAILIALIVPVSAGEPLLKTTVSVDLVRRHITTLASPEMEGRGTPIGKKRAAEYILGCFRDLKLQPLFGDEYTQAVPGPTRDDGKPTFAGKNLGAYLRGSDPRLRDEWIILAAHYDHLGIRKGKLYPGADDNASSVAMMLEVARQLSQGDAKPRRSVAFVSFDLEESLLWGSRWFVAHPPMPLEDIKLFVTAELLGRRLGDLPLPLVFVMGAEQATGLREIVDAVSPPQGLEAAHLGIDLVGVRSDYGPFQEEKVPFLFFSGGEHSDYHQPTDTADRIDHDRVARVSDYVLEILRSAADADGAVEWTDAPQHDLGEVQTIRRITTSLLAEDDASKARGESRLTAIQRLVVANVHTRTAQILERGALDPADRPWLVRSAQLLLLTVF